MCVLVEKNALFALIYASIMSFVFYFIKAPLGYWSIPIILVIAQTVVKPVKAYLWQAQPVQGLRKMYVEKQNIYMASLYGFYGLLATIAVTGVQYLNVPFVPAFGVAVLIALLATIMFEFHYLYEQQFDLKTALYLFCIAVALAIATTVSIVLLVSCGIQGKPATIIACVSAKIIEQYVLSRWLCSQKACALCNQE